MVSYHGLEYGLKTVNPRDSMITDSISDMERPAKFKGKKKKNIKKMDRSAMFKILNNIERDQDRDAEAFIM